MCLVTHLDARWNFVGIAINLPKDILLTSSIVMKVTPQMFFSTETTEKLVKVFGENMYFLVGSNKM